MADIGSGRGSRSSVQIPARIMWCDSA